ncbi:DsbA family protein [Chitinophagaceae bacterium MMS25-I14]
MKKGTIIYVMDPLCGWCYGYSEVMQQLQAKHKEDFDFRIITGGMITGSRVAPVSEMAQYILSAYKRVEEYSGAVFGEPYLDMLRKGTEINNSELPCRAIYTMGQFRPDEMLDYAHALQLKLFREGKSLNDETTYRELAAAFDLDPDVFIAAMNSEENKYGTQQDFQWVQAAKINGFPCTILQKEDQYYLLSRGYQNLDGVEKVLESALKETAN